MIDSIESAFDRLGDLLRLVAPGWVCLFASAAVDRRIRELLMEFDDVKIGVPLLGAGLLGVVLYSIHTGVLIRLVFWPGIVGRLAKKSKWKPNAGTSKSEIMHDLDTQRWLRRASKVPTVIKFQQEMDRWAAYVNFLYCSGIGIILTMNLQSFFRRDTFDVEYGVLSFVFGIVMVIAAGVSNYRMTDRAMWAAHHFRQKVDSQVSI